MKSASARCRSLVFGLLLLALVHPAAAQWTLERSMQRALAVAPELEAGAAREDARRAAARQAGAWPNPTLELSADNGIARERGGSSHELSTISLSQPLPLGLRTSRRAAAEALVTVESLETRITQLELERRVAESFHRLQLAQTVLERAREASREARDFAAAGERRAAAGDISKRETLRLGLLASESAQAIEAAEGEWQEALSDFAALLDLAPQDIDALPALSPPLDLPPLDHWLAMVESHPQLERHQAGLAVIGAERQLARSERLPQIGVRIFGERELVDGSRESVTGVGLSLELPLWDRRQGRMAELAAATRDSQAQMHGERRRLLSRIHVQHQHLFHLVAQANHQHEKVLQPAREILALTRQGYLSGELELLALIEAVQTTRNAEARYQNLLADAWVELAALRTSAGQFLITPDSEIRR